MQLLEAGGTDHNVVDFVIDTGLSQCGPKYASLSSLPVCNYDPGSRTDKAALMYHLYGVEQPGAVCHAGQQTVWSRIEPVVYMHGLTVIERGRRLRWRLVLKRRDSGNEVLYRTDGLLTRHKVYLQYMICDVLTGWYDTTQGVFTVHDM